MNEVFLLLEQTPEVTLPFFCCNVKNIAIIQQLFNRCHTEYVTGTKYIPVQKILLMKNQEQRLFKYKRASVSKVQQKNPSLPVRCLLWMEKCYMERLYKENVPIMSLQPSVLQPEMGFFSDIILRARGKMPSFMKQLRSLLKELGPDKQLNFKCNEQI